MASKKAPKTGKRYTPEQKQEIVDFVNEHNAQNGRGGAAAASKKFGASQLSIGAWLKATTEPKKSSKAKTSNVSTGKRSKALNELIQVESEIALKRKELSKLETRFQKFKTML